MIDLVLISQRHDGDLAGKLAANTWGGTAFSTTAGSYIGGQPVGLGVSGLIFGTGVTDSNYIGMFYNNSAIDTDVGANVVGSTAAITEALPAIVWKTGVKARLQLGTRGSVPDTRAPFASGVTWAVGDHLYLDNTQGGQWSNVSAANATISHGRVIVPPASVDDKLEAEFFDTLGAVGAVGA